MDYTLDEVKRMNAKGSGKTYTLAEVNAMRSAEPGPWDDYKKPEKPSSGPWDDYKPAAVNSQKSATGGKWIVDAEPAGQWVIDDEPAKPKGSGSGVVDAGNALGTGYFRGLARFAGLATDTVANVRDLGKAAIGAPYIALSGKAPPSWLEIGDRAKVVGSGDYLIDKLGKTRAGNVMLNPVNPDYEGGYTQLAGGALTGVMRPGSAAQAVNQGVNSVLGASTAKATYDATGNTAWAALAGLSPTMLRGAATAGIKRAVRGGEAGRLDMEQRIRDLKNAGINNPTLGLASGNSLIGGMENLLSSTPGAMGVMSRARGAALEGLTGKVQGAAGAASPNRGALESGTAIQGGIRDFRDNFKTTQGGLYGRMDQFIAPLTPVNVSGTKGALATMNQDIPGAPALSKQFKNSRIMAIEAAIKSDTAGTAPGVMQNPVGGGGMWNAPVLRPSGVTNIPAGSSTDLLPFQAVKQTRTLVGNEIADGGLLSDVPRSKWNALYGAISGDMQGAANQAGPQASKAFNRANDYTRAGIERLDRVAPFAAKVAPEQAYTALVQATKENVSTLQAVKKTLPEGARGTVAGTIIERLGKATNGVQNESGTAWSPEAFLTNWNKMTPRAREEVFSGFKNSEQVMADVSAVAKASSMMRDNSRLWANPSGTGANLAARGLMGAVAGGGAASLAGLMSPAVPLMAGGGLLGANALARGLTNQRYINSAAQRTYIAPEMLAAQARALIGGGLLGN